MKSNNLIYLASPYSHPKKSVRVKRWRDITAIGAILIEQGYCLFGPITESHCYSEAKKTIGTGWDFWKGRDLRILAACDELWVIKLEGWEQSKGVAGEIEYARDRGIPITYIEPKSILEG